MMTISYIQKFQTIDQFFKKRKREYIRILLLVTIQSFNIIYIECNGGKEGREKTGYWAHFLWIYR